MTKSKNISERANIVKTKQLENRADTQVDDLLLQALLSNTALTRDLALNIPSLSSAIGFIGDMVSMVPLKLYEEKDNKITEIKDDPRIKLFNDDTGDTLDSVQFWKALVQDYFLGKGGYAYLYKKTANLSSVHYVDDRYIAINKNSDPIFKDYNILVNGKSYKPFDFLKILRNTKDGARGISIIEESPYLLSVCWNMLKYEDTLVKKGGVRDGFLESDNELAQEAIDALQDAWANQYGNNEKSTAMVLNSGIKWNAASLSSTEMQLDENKQTNAKEVCKLLRISESILKGSSTDQDFKNSIITGVMPVLIAIQSAMNRDCLLEKEKSTKYWAFDTTELTKADIKTRYEAYKIGLEANFLQLDEVRYKEDLEPLDFNYMKLNLGDVFFNPKTREIYSPNTGKSANIDTLNTDNTDMEGGV